MQASSKDDEVYSAARFYVEYPYSVMKENLEFLKNNYKEVLLSSMELVVDALNIESWTAPSRKLPEDEQDMVYSKYLFYPMLLNILIPNAYFVPPLVLMGALPYVFYALRTNLEAITIAVYADCEHKLADLDILRKLSHRSIKESTFYHITEPLEHIIAERLGKEKAKKLGAYLRELHQALSAWVHPIARIKLEKFTVPAGPLVAIYVSLDWRRTPPVYSLMIPNTYSEEDLKDLEYVNQVINATRFALATLVYVWSIGKDWVNREAIWNHYVTTIEKFGFNTEREQ